jgi:hypothetical protein
MAEIKHNQGAAGGYLVGNRHSEGGIKAVNKSTGQPLEMEGGEVVITRNAVSDPTKRSFNGKMMTNREILSTINQSGGGVAFAEGGEVPASIDYVDMVMEYDGEQLDSRRVLEKMATGGQIDDILTSLDAENVLNGNCQPCGGDLEGKFEDGGDTSLTPEPYRAQIVSFKLRYTDQRSNSTEEGRLNSILDMPSDLGYFLRRGAILETDKFDVVTMIRVDTDKNSKGNTVEFNYTTSIPELNNKTYSEIVNALESTLVVGDKTIEDFRKVCKVYFLGCDDFKVDYSVDTDKNLNPQLTRYKTTDDYRNQNDYNSLTNQFSFEAKSNNYKDFERLSKELIAKKATTFGIISRVYLKTFGIDGISRDYAFQSIYSADFVNNPSKTKLSWLWWKTNWFSNNAIGYYASSLSKQPAFNLILDDIDYSAYECPNSIVKSKRRTEQTQNKLVEYLGKVKNAQSINLNGGGAIYNVDEPFFDIDVEKTRYSNRSVYLWIKYMTSNYGEVPLRVEVEQNQYFFEGDKGIFYFDNIIGLEVGFDLEKRELERQKRLEAELKAKAQAKAEEEARKAAEEAFKNRPFKVRDQETDLKFFPLYRDSTVDEDISIAREALKKEADSLRTLLKFTTGAKMADERAAIMREINLLERKEVKLAQAMINKLAFSTLLSPQNLLDYYYNQATQNPTQKLGDPSGLSTPSGKPSKLPLQAYYAVRTPFFKKWFGDWELAYQTRDYRDCSILVDEETGEPRLMYHGVRKKIPGVSMGAMGSGVKRPYGEFNPPNFPATYFTDDYDYVKFYAGEADNQPKVSPDYEGFIYSVFINMRNPVVLTDLGLKTSYKELLANIYLNYGVRSEPSKDLLKRIANDTNADLKTWNYIRYDVNLIEMLKRAGYDGIIQIGDVPKFGDNGQMVGMQEGDEYLVFDGAQVKSATVKNSFYVPFIKDIRFKEGGHVRI